MMRKEDRATAKPWPRPAYNGQVGVAGQMIVGFRVHQTPGDAGCLIAHLEQPGKALTYQETIPHRSQNGYLSERRIYACHHCPDCPLKPECRQAHGNRRITVSLALRRYRQQTPQNLLFEHGSRLRKQRGMLLEAVLQISNTISDSEDSTCVGRQRLK